jgi:hypothetical protein
MLYNKVCIVLSLDNCLGVSTTVKTVGHHLKYGGASLPSVDVCTTLAVNIVWSQFQPNKTFHK